MDVTLYVWKLRPDNPGHVSLQIGTSYASYWPQGGAGKNDVKLGATHEPNFPSCYRADIKLEHKPCDEQRVLAGLATDRMEEAWKQFVLDQRRYNMVAHNCSTVIAALLEVGSGQKPSFIPQVAIDDHAVGWASRMFLRVRFLSSSIRMWTPDAVLRYADEIRGNAAAP
jgi:hypothetical protein